MAKKGKKKKKKLDDLHETIINIKIIGNDDL